MMAEFKSSRARLVCATDVVSRGLDGRDITHVINYEMPNKIEDYVNRIGRTGNAEHPGISISFLTRGKDDPSLAK